MSSQTDIVAESIKGMECFTKQQLDKLKVVWERIGLNQMELESRVTQYQNECSEICQRLLDTDLKVADELSSKISHLMDDVEMYNNDLGLDIKIDFNGITLRAAKTELENFLQNTKLTHKSRLDEKMQLEAQEALICKNLGRDVVSTPAPDKPLSDTVLAGLRDKIERLKQDKETKRQEFEEKRREIIDFFSELEARPNTDFEIQVTGPTPDNFPLDPQSMAKLAALHANLADSVKQLSDETELLRRKLHHLWDKVQVSHDERAKFLDTYPGIKTKTRQEICKEIDRCQELHKQQVTAATQDLRGKLFDLWVKCYVRDEERGEFAAFKSEDFTEKVLQEHKTEVERYESYHQENQEVFNLLSRRDKLYERLDELEMAALDSGRLNNRGGQLLKDEKEKKAIEKEIPVIDKSLKDARLQVNGEPLTINHRPVLDIINEQWECKRQLKETEKKSKLSEAGIKRQLQIPPAKKLKSPRMNES